VGDDRLQKATRGYVVPDSFTHGTAEQRRRWFMKGFRSGRLSDGNAFEVPYSQL
jgi:predicted metalloprotease